MLALAVSYTPPAYGTIDDALSFALEAADPYVKEGFTVREDYWGGDLPVKTSKTIVHQLFKGNEYWFWMGTDPANAKIPCTSTIATGSWRRWSRGKRRTRRRPGWCRSGR